MCSSDLPSFGELGEQLLGAVKADLEPEPALGVAPSHVPWSIPVPSEVTPAIALDRSAGPVPTVAELLPVHLFLQGC